MVYTLRFFPLQNAVCFIMLTYLVPVLFTFYIQGVLKLKNNSGTKRLILDKTFVFLSYNSNPTLKFFVLHTVFIFLVQLYKCFINEFLFI